MKKPEILKDRKKVIAFGLLLVTSGLFAPVYDKAVVVWGVEGAADIWNWILAEKEQEENPAPPPPDPIPPPNDQASATDVLTTADWWGKPSERAGDWPIVASLIVKDVNSSTARWEPTPPLQGRDTVMCYFVMRDGRWVGSGFDGGGEGGWSSKVKTWSNAKKGIPAKGRSDEQRWRDYVALRNGDVVAACLIGVGSKTRTSAYGFEFPSGKPVDLATTPQPAPPPSDPVASFVPPARTGSPSYAGSGAFNGFLDIGRAADNPRSSVEISAWVRVDAWSKAEGAEGAVIARKGTVGSSWAFGLTLHPDRIAWNVTKGDIAAPARIARGQWHHVKAVADSRAVKFWLDGNPLQTQSTALSPLGSNNDPIRIGGYLTPWAHATWFNQSLNGQLTDWSIVVR